MGITAVQRITSHSGKKWNYTVLRSPFPLQSTSKTNLCQAGLQPKLPSPTAHLFLVKMYKLWQHHHSHGLVVDEQEGHPAIILWEGQANAKSTWWGGRLRLLLSSAVSGAESSFSNINYWSPFSHLFTIHEITFISALMPEQLVLYYKHILSTDEAGKIGRSGHPLLTHGLTSTCEKRRGAPEEHPPGESDMERSSTEWIQRKIQDRNQFQ